jgi:hypothetical protein
VIKTYLEVLNFGGVFFGACHFQLMLCNLRWLLDWLVYCMRLLHSGFQWRETRSHLQIIFIVLEEWKWIVERLKQFATAEKLANFRLRSGGSDAIIPPAPQLPPDVRYVIDPGDLSPKT